MPALPTGSAGDAVHTLQRLLNAVVAPRPPLIVDGDYGEKTRRAVLAAQRLLKLEPTGEADAALLVALEARLAPAAATPVFPSEATWMAIARGELGQVERRGGENPRIVAYHATTTLAAREDEVAWCSSFVNWVLERAGYKGTDSAAASSWLRWGVELEAPRPGCVTVLKRKGRSRDAATGSTTGFHVAFFVARTATHVQLLGGNQSDAVKYSSYPLARYDVRGYRWPA
jgi:uncharacterized protein (TIGR02594 family)